MNYSKLNIGSMFCRLLFWLAVLGHGQCYAVAPWESLYQPVFHTIERDGRPFGGPIRAFTQDKLGFIWITGDTSLWRWDGYELHKVQFETMLDDDPNLPDVTIAKADPNGIVWVTTTSGLFRVETGSLKLRRVTLGALDKVSLEHLAFDFSGPRKRLYLGTLTQVYQWDMGRAAVAVSELPTDNIQALLVDRAATLWVGSNTGLRYRLHNQSQLQALPNLQGVRISALHQTSDHKLWIGTAKAGVFIHARGQVQKIRLPASSAIQPWVYDINAPTPDELWFATYGNGILVYDTATGAFKSIRKERMLQSNLLDNDIWSLFHDRNGTLWVGSRTGANFLNTRQPAFRHLPAGEPGKWLSDGLIYSMAALPDGSVAVGTGSNGIDVLHPTTGIAQHLPIGTPLGSMRMPDSAIESMMALPDGRLLFGSNWNTPVLDFKTKRASELQVEGRSADAFTSSFALFDDSLWLAGTDGLWQIKNNQAHNLLANSTGEQRINCLLADGDILWIGTWKGLQKLTKQAGKESIISRVNHPQLNQKYINVLHKDPQGRVWVGTYNGGLFYSSDKQSTQWIQIAEKDGLPGNNVTGILSDDEGNLWIGSDGGIARIDSKTLAINAIQPETGAAAAPYEAAAQSTSGDLLFGGNNGITVVTPSLWKKQPTDAALVFTSVTDGKEQPLVLTSNNNLPPTLTLAVDTDMVSIKFAALDFINAAHLQYRYRLLGRDSNWRSVQTASRTVVLEQLPPKAYELQIGYSIDGQQWSAHTLSLPISVLPAWHERLAIRLLLVALLLASLGLLLSWWLNRVHSQQQFLEASVRERTEQLQAANQQLQQQAKLIEEASLTDPLTGLYNRRFFTQSIDNETRLAIRRHHDAKNGTAEQADLLFFLIDIDNFKRINDLLGHAAGDAVLIEMRHRLQQVFRSSDFLIRWGGEEFFVVARNASRQQASELAERTRLAVSSTPFACGRKEPVEVTCSIGYAPFPFANLHPEALTWQETLALADVALYAAKKSGRNSWIGFTGYQSPELEQLLPMLRNAPEAALQSSLLGVSRSN